MINLKMSKVFYRVTPRSDIDLNYLNNFYSHPKELDRIQSKLNSIGLLVSHRVLYSVWNKASQKQTGELSWPTDGDGQSHLEFIASYINVEKTDIPK